MNQQLSPKAITAAIAGVAVLLLVGAFFVFKNSLAPAPTVTPKHWGPPGNWAGAPVGQPGAPPAGSPGARFGGGGAMGAPSPQR